MRDDPRHEDNLTVTRKPVRSKTKLCLFSLVGVEVFLRIKCDVSRILRTKLMICWVSTAARRPCRSASPSGINHTGEPWQAIKLRAMMMLIMIK